MEDARSKYPSLPSSYVSIIQLRERWMREQQLIEEQKERELARVSQTPKDNAPAPDDTPPKFQGRRKFHRNSDRRPRTTEECSHKQQCLEVGEDRQKVEVGQRKPRAAKFKTDRRTGQVEFYNPEQAEVGCQMQERLKLGKYDRRVGDCCGKSGMAVAEEEIRYDGKKTALVSQTPKDNDPAPDDTPPKFQGRRKFHRNSDRRPRTTEECSHKQKCSEVGEDRQKVKVGQQKPRAAKFKTDRRTGQVESYNPGQAEVGCQMQELLKLGKDDRRVGDCCGKSGMEAMAVAEEEIKDDGEKTAGLKKKMKKRYRGKKPRAEEELAGGTVQPTFKSGNEEKCPSAVNQMDGIQLRMEKVSVNPVKPEGSRGSTSTHIHMNGYQMKPRVSGRSDSRKATGAGLAWVRKGETPYG